MEFRKVTTCDTCTRKTFPPRRWKMKRESRAAADCLMQPSNHVSRPISSLALAMSRCIMHASTIACACMYIHTWTCVASLGLYNATEKLESSERRVGFPEASQANDEREEGENVCERGTEAGRKRETSWDWILVRFDDSQGWKNF